MIHFVIYFGAGFVLYFITAALDKPITITQFLAIIGVIFVARVIDAVVSYE